MRDIHWNHFYRTVSDTRQFKGGPQKCYIQAKQKYIDNIEKWSFMVIFLYDLYVYKNVRII